MGKSNNNECSRELEEAFTQGNVPKLRNEEQSWVSSDCHQYL